MSNFDLPTTQFDLVDKEGVQTTTFAQLQIPKLILYFYPKDNTQGCTLQATDFSTHLPSFAQKGYTVIGVSKDSVKSHQNFIKKHDLSIALISDTTQTLCQHFDVLKPKMLYGKSYIGIVRSTFVLIEGVLYAHYPKVSAKNHALFLLDVLP